LCEKCCGGKPVGFKLFSIKPGSLYSKIGLQNGDVINRIRGPFNTALLQQLAGAAAVRDRDHFWKAVEHNNKWLPWITAEIRKTGLRVDDSVANFVLVYFNQSTGVSASAADAFLTARGIIVRAVGSYGLPDCLRITIGTEEANRLVVEGLRDYVAEVRRG
jgi:histidinol-phosphate aminotransferase